MEQLAGNYQSGNGVPQDDNESLKYFKMAAERGSTYALYTIGNYYLEGNFVEQDYTKALEFFKKAADPDAKVHSWDNVSECAAMYRLGQMYENGEGVDKDINQAVDWYTKSADLYSANSKLSIRRLMEIYYFNEELKDIAQTLKWLIRAADDDYDSEYKPHVNSLADWFLNNTIEDIVADIYHGSKSEAAEAFYNLGQLCDKYIYTRSSGKIKITLHVEEEENIDVDSKVIKLYRIAADLGNAEAMYELGYRIYKKDTNKSFKWINEAAQLGNAEAMIRLGEMYMDGEGVEQSYDEAIKYLEQANELVTERNVIKRLAICYIKTQPIPQNDDNMYALFKKVSRDEATINSNIGLMYYKLHDVHNHFEKAFEYFSKAAEFDEEKALFCLGYMYEFGECVSVDKAKAFEYFLKAAQLGETSSKFHLIRYYIEGEVVPRNMTEALKWLLKLNNTQDLRDELKTLANFFVQIRTDEILAMYNQDKSKTADVLFKLAQKCDDEFSLPENDYADYRPDKNAIELFKKADELDHKYAAKRLGELYYLKCNGVSSRDDFKTSHKWFKRAARFNIPIVIYNTAMGYYNFQKYDLAMKWLKKAADLNYPDAFNMIGERYYFGNKGVEENLEEAVKFFKKAADLGNTDAMFHLGDCYMHGKGVKQNEAEALKWFIKRHDGDEAEGMAHLAYMYNWDSNNYTKSFEWYSKAAELGNLNAIYSLGCAYEEGEGVEKDSAKALEYYLKAADKDNEDGIHGAIELYLNDENLKNIPAALNLMIDKDEYYMHEIEQIVEIFVKVSEAEILAMYNQDKTTAMEAINNLVELYKEECGEYEDDCYTNNLTALHQKATNLEKI